MSEHEYWSDFYTKQRALVPEEPSTFASFVASKWLSNEPALSGLTLVDLGCGTARDSRYFASLGLKIIGVVRPTQSAWVPTKRILWVTLAIWAAAKCKR
jgi:hypothetical protein